MLLVIILILAVSLVLYTLLGGADFGAGIIGIFAGRRGDKTISNAIAPVWEANHVWLILAIVIIFTGFPAVYVTFSLYLHIPLMIVLLGIVLRGSSFIFHYYDLGDHPIHKYFTAFFKISSFITPVFLGITVGAMTWGGIGLQNDGSFYQRFIYPWCNVFCFTLGLFATALFAYIAAAFLTGETTIDDERKKYIRLAKIFLSLTFLLGIVVFLRAEHDKLQLIAGILRSPLSITSFITAALLTPLIFYLFSHPNILYLRMMIGLQVTLALIGWFAIHFPILIYEKNGQHLTLLNTRAPDATLLQLLIALFVGLLLVIPAFYYLFKVFKKVKI